MTAPHHDRDEPMRSQRSAALWWSDARAPFDDGEEDAAKAWLAAGPEVPALRCSAAESRPRTMGFTVPVVVVVATFGAIVYIAEATFEIFAILCGLGLFVVLAWVIAERLSQRGPGELCALPAIDALQVRGETVARLSELGVPRFDPDHHGEYEVLAHSESFHGPVIACARLGGGPPVVLFDRPCNPAFGQRLPRIAAHLNEMFAEQDARRIARSWLERREREASALPFRREQDREPTSPTTGEHDVGR